MDAQLLEGGFTNAPVDAAHAFRAAMNASTASNAAISSGVTFTLTAKTGTAVSRWR